MDDWVCLADPAGTILATNKAGEAITGRTRGEIVGSICCALLHDRPEPLPDCPRLEALRARRRVCRAAHPVGPDLWMGMVADPVYDGTGRLVGVVQRFRHVSQPDAAKHVLEDTEARYQSLVEASPDAIFLLDPAGDILSANARAATLTGHDSPSELLGRSADDLLVPHEAAGSERRVPERRAAGRVEGVRYQVRPPDGPATEVEANVAVLRDDAGEPAGRILVARDVTRRGKLERTLHRQRVRLRELAVRLLATEERERRRLAIDLHDGVGQLLQALRLKMNDLRRLGGDGPEGDEADALVREALDQTRSLAVQLSPPALYDLGLSAAVRWLAGNAPWLVDVEVSVAGDLRASELSEKAATLLYRSVLELLRNVAAHAQAGEARVTLGLEGGAVTARVEDDGIGFSHEAMAPDVGFGLFSVRESLTVAGGEVEIESRRGVGTRVCLRLPPRPTETEGQS